MSKTTTNLRLSPITIGYLHYLVQEGETNSLYEIIDILIANYVEHIAEENELDINEINAEAMVLYKSTRRSQTAKSRQEQESRVKKSLDRLKVRDKNKDATINKEINFDDLEDNF